MLHLVLISWGDKVSVILLIVLLWELLSGLCEINLNTAGASSTWDNVASVDLLEGVLLDILGCEMC